MKAKAWDTKVTIRQVMAAFQKRSNYILAKLHGCFPTYYMLYGISWKNSNLFFYLFTAFIEDDKKSDDKTSQCCDVNRQQHILGKNSLQNES